MNIRNVTIGAIATAVVALGIYTVKKVNDDRKLVEEEVEEGLFIERDETFKEAAARKVNEILGWVNENSEKVSAATTIISTVATVIGVATGVFQLYSSYRDAKEDPNAELLKEVDEIRLRLACLTPDMEVTAF